MINQVIFVFYVDAIDILIKLKLKIELYQISLYNYDK